MLWQDDDDEFCFVYNMPEIEDKQQWNIDVPLFIHFDYLIYLHNEVYMYV